jgi:hypothetical protein
VVARVAWRATRHSRVHGCYLWGAGAHWGTHMHEVAHGRACHHAILVHHGHVHRLWVHWLTMLRVRPPSRHLQQLVTHLGRAQTDCLAAVLCWQQRRSQEVISK